MGSTNAAVRSVRFADILGVREVCATPDRRAGLLRSQWRELGTLEGGGCEDQVTEAVHAKIPIHAPEEQLRERSPPMPRIHPEHAHPSGNGNADAAPWALPVRHRDACRPANDLQSLLAS